MRASIDDLLNPYIDKTKILSIDCFDTLLWRKVAAPFDVFYDLQRKPPFHRLGITAKQRLEAERNARLYISAEHGSYEVKLREIYEIGFPSLSQKQIKALMEEEVAAEIEACYAFPFIIQLIRNAQSRGLKIIVVSSTYLEESQLRRLLSSTMPTDAYKAIDQVFCSCDFRVAKHKGLFKQILMKLDVPAETILHIGDNEIADLHAPKAVGMQAWHIIQQDAKISELMRLQTIAATLADPSIRYTRGLPSPFKGFFATAPLNTAKPEQLLGYVSLGPILFAFAQFIKEDIKKMQAAGKKPKVVFLMRDAYLSSLACEVLDENFASRRVHISRFSATAASFRSKEDVLRYLTKNFKSWPLAVHCKQLLLSREIAEKLIKEVENAENILQAFYNRVTQEDILEIILENSKAYAKRLYRYLQNEISLQAGDTLVLVDLGYIGSVQRLLTPILMSEMGVKELAGRYLVAMDYPEWQFSSRGLIDASWCDTRTIDTLLTSFSLIEEMNCLGGYSVVDYDEEGKPIFLKVSVDEDQLARTRYIQAECIRFLKDAKIFFEAANFTPSTAMLREAALAELMRSVFFMTETEVNYLNAFHHDINMTTDLKFPIFLDTPRAEQRLRRSSKFKLKNMQALRRVTPLEEVIAIMAENRFSFDRQPLDFMLQRERITLNIWTVDKMEQQVFEAIPTHGGYFSLGIALAVKGKIRFEILLGLHYQWVQLESTELINVNYEHIIEEKQLSEDLWNNLNFNQMIDHGGKLFQCTSKESSIKIELDTPNNTSAFRLVFRPIV